MAKKTKLIFNLILTMILKLNLNLQRAVWRNEDQSKMSSLSRSWSQIGPHNEYKSTYSYALQSETHIFARIQKKMENTTGTLMYACLQCCTHSHCPRAYRTNTFHFIPWITGPPLEIYFIIDTYCSFLCGHSESLLQIVLSFRGCS